MVPENTNTLSEVSKASMFNYYEMEISKVEGKDSVKTQILRSTRDGRYFREKN